MTSRPRPSWARLFHPDSVAVLGASSKPGSYGLQAVRYLQRFHGAASVFAVNPKYAEIEGLRCYPQLAALPRAPDVAIVLLSPERVAPALDACAEAGVAFVILAGDLPRERWPEARRCAGLDEGGPAALRLVGPNCVGVIHARDGVALSTSSALGAGRLIPGRIAVVSQSGGVLGSILNRGQDRSIGFSHLISCGQELDLTALDFLDTLLEAPDTAVVGMILERVDDPARFRALAQRAAVQGRPIVLLRSGRSPAGRAVAETHSGRLAGDEEALAASVRQSGACRVRSLDEFLDAAAALAAERRPAGRRLGIVSTSGGFCAHVADLCAEAGLEIPPPSPLTTRALEETLGSGPILNPLDIAGAGRPDAGPPLVRRALEAMDKDAGLDVLVAADTTLLPAAELADEVLAFARFAVKPFVVCWSAGEHTLEAVRRLEEAGLVVFRTAEGLAAALAACAEFHEVGLRPGLNAAPPLAPLAREAILARLPAAGGSWSEPRTKELLACAGIAVTREAVARSPIEAAAHAGAIGFPVALKWVSGSVLHKSDHGGVRLGVATAEEAARAYCELVAAAEAQGLTGGLEGILVQEMKPAAVEIFVGARWVPGTGVVILCGLGGLWVEALGDVSRRITPLAALEAEAMLRELRGFPVLTGAHGRSPADVPALVDLLVRVGALAEVLGERLDTLDLNPVHVGSAGSGVCTLDAGLTLHPSGERNA